MEATYESYVLKMNIIVILRFTEIRISLDGDKKYATNGICKMIEFLADNTHGRIGGLLFRQPTDGGIPLGTKYAPLLPDLFLHLYENDFLNRLIKDGKRKLAVKFYLAYRNANKLICFNSERFNEFNSDIYPKELLPTLLPNHLINVMHLDSTL